MRQSSLSSILSEEVVPSPSVVIHGGIYVTGISSSATFSSPTLVRGNPTIYPTGILSTEAVGTHALDMHGKIYPSGIASGSTIGTPTVS